MTTITRLERRHEGPVESLCFMTTFPGRDGWYAQAEHKGATLFLSRLDHEERWVVDGMTPAGTAMPAFMHGWGSRVTRLHYAPAEVQDVLDRWCPICKLSPECRHVWCSTHEVWTEATDRSGPGFAGGTIIHIDYACGCNEHDESDDLRAAR